MSERLEEWKYDLPVGSIKSYCLLSNAKKHASQRILKRNVNHYIMWLKFVGLMKEAEQRALQRLYVVGGNIYDQARKRFKKAQH